MDANMFVDTAQTAGLPAPHWFIQFFKVLGFTLHAVPMNLWYAGLLLALCLHLSRNRHGRLFAARFIAQMPVIVAVGVNLGIVPLLFIQVAYFKFFYPATILMAWFWLGIIALLIPAYYGVYVYAWELRKGENGIIKGWRRAAGWVAAMFFIVIGFIFANGLSLMDHVGRWEEIWSQNSVAGAALGTGLNVGDPTLWPRWLLMFGLALCTTAVWILVDTTFFHRNPSEEYKSWTWRFAKILYTVGMIWAAAAGTWYVFGTWSEELRKTMFSGPMVVLTVLTGMAPGLPWIMIVTEQFCPAKRSLVAGIALAQVGLLGINAVSRQVVQNINLAAVFDVFSQKIDVQWGPMVMFLAAFVLGLGVVAWMIAQVLKSESL